MSCADGLGGIAFEGMGGGDRFELEVNGVGEVWVGEEGGGGDPGDHGASVAITPGEVGDESELGWVKFPFEGHFPCRDDDGGQVY